MCLVSLAELPTPGGRGAVATLGNPLISDPHTPTGFGAWNYVAVFFGAIWRAAPLGSACLGAAQLGVAVPAQWLSRNVEQQVVPGRAVRAGEESPHRPLAAVLGLPCPCPCTSTVTSSVTWLSVW